MRLSVSREVGRGDPTTIVGVQHLSLGRDSGTRTRASLCVFPSCHARLHSQETKLRLTPSTVIPVV